MKRLNPPIAKSEHKILKIHNTELVDDYAWLRNKDDDEVIDYLKKENEYTEKMMTHTKEFQNKLYNEIKGRIKETDQSVPVKIDDYYYYYRTEEGKNYAIHCRKKGSMDAEEQVLVDENKLAEGHEFFRLGALEISSNHQIMAYSTDFSGYETYTIHFVDLNAMEFLDDKVSEVDGNIVWANDNKSIYYGILDKTHRSYAVGVHKLNSSQTGDKVIIEELDEEFSVSYFKTKDKRYLVFDIGAADTNEVKYLRLDDPTDIIKSVTPRVNGTEIYMASHNNNFYVLTNEDAVNFKLMRGIEDAHKSNWKEIIPHDINTKLMNIEAFENYLVIYKRTRGIPGIMIYEYISRDIHEIKMPEEIYSLSFWENPVYKTDIFRFSFSSMVTPNTVFDYNMKSKELVTMKINEVKGYNPELFETKRLWATAEDNTKIPVSVAYKRGVVLDGNDTLLLYGYGSYGYSVDPGFNSSILSLIERGMIFVIAHIRGGGSLGEPWYLQGKLLNKMNTFTDFIAAAEYLVKENYTNPDKLTIMGGSAGGLLMGAVTNLRPDLFHNVVALVPFVDVINTMLDGSIPLTTGEYREWGNPNEKKYFDYMMKYSPYDNVKEREYPNILVTGGLNDPRVHFWEPTKWVAKLRKLKKDNNKLILKMNMGAGHSGASGRYEYIKELAFRFAFIIDNSGIELR